MARPDTMERLREDASGIAALLVTGIWLSLMLAGFEYWLPLMLFGYVVVVPLVSTLFDEDEADERSAGESATSTEPAAADAEDVDGDAALARLRERYADGELTDEQFERKVERLLETDTLENAEDRRRDRERSRDREPGRERETEFE